MCLGQAWALPQGGQVVAGTAVMVQQGNTLTITNSANAIIDWRSFSIAQSETTNFIQPSATSAVLNRVVGSDPSQLLGTLSSNGRVFLINPAGILIGQGAKIDVAGLVASTLNLSNENFLAGKYRFDLTSNAGSVQNQGEIRTPAGGSVYLIGSKVSNEGIIQSPQGEVILAAGESVQLIDTGSPGVKVEVTGRAGNVTNLGDIVAQSGRIGLVGAVVANQGLVDASSVVRDGGRIFLKATSGVTTTATSRITASGTQGGAVTLQADDGDTVVQGRIEATGSGAAGGTVQVLGNRVGLLDGAQIDASGASRGGTVLVGGDYQGKNPEVQNARATYVASTVTIRSDAIQMGDGGKIILWSDDLTRFCGNISARGGAGGGNGGFVEVSGKKTLAFRGHVDLTAPRGSGGMLLLDPTDITIVAGAAYDGVAGDLGNGVWDFGESGSQIGVDDIKTQLLGGNLTLQATNNITWSSVATLDYNGIGNTGRILTLQANNAINFNGAIIDSALGTGDLLHVVLNADRDANGAGHISLSNALINSGGGNITLGGGTSPLTTAAYGTADGIPGIDLYNSRLIAGAGNISLRGTGFTGGTSHNAGVRISASTPSEIQTTSGTITIVGKGGDNATMCCNEGVYLDGGSSSSNIVRITTDTGSISITGYGGNSTAPNSSGYGIGMWGTKISSTGTTGGNITLAGTGGNAGNNGAGNMGIFAYDTGAVIEAVNGTIDITGTGQGQPGAVQNHGIVLSNGASIISTGNSIINLTGDSLSDDGYGIYLGSSTSTIGGPSATGPITLTAGGPNADQIYLYGASIRTTGYVRLQPLDPTASIGVAGGVGAFNLDSADLAAVQSGYGRITIGRDNSMGALDFGAGGYTFSGEIALYSPGAGSDGISLQGPLNAGTSFVYLTTGGPISGGGAITSGVLELAGSSIGTLAIPITISPSGTVNATATSGDIYLKQTGALQTGNYTLSAAGVGQTIMLAGATGLTVNSLAGFNANTADDHLVLDGGTGNITSTANFVLSDGSLTVSSPATFNGLFTLSGGALNGAGNVTLAGGLDYLSGSIGLTGILNIVHAGNLALPAMTSLTALNARATGDVTLNGNIAVSGSGNSLVLAAGGNFLNPGNATLNPGAGRWLVYSQDPTGINKGGLTSSFRHYSGSYSSYGPGSVTESGNGFIYTTAPGTLSVNVAINGGPASHQYGSTPTGSPVFTLTGFADAEDATATIGLAGSASYSLLPSTTTNAGSYMVTYTGGLTNTVGYGFAAGTGIGYTVTPAPLTVTANNLSKTYGQAWTFAGNEFTATGLLNGDAISSVILASPGALATANATGALAAPYAITPSGAAGATFNAANYSISYVDGAFTVAPRAITVVAGAQSKVYGDLDPVFGYTVAGAGLVNGDTLSGSLVRVAGENVGSYAINQGTLSGGGNYTIGYAGNNLAITPAPLSYVADPVSRAPGDVNPLFTGSITGLRFSDTLLTVASGTAAFDSPATTTSPAGQYPIWGSGLTLISSNYQLVQAPGNATALTVAVSAPPEVGGLIQAVVAATNSTVTSATSGGTAGTTSTAGASAAGSNIGTGPAVLPPPTLVASAAEEPTLTDPQGTVGGGAGEFGGGSSAGGPAKPNSKKVAACS